MRHPNCYLVKGKDAVASALENLEDVKSVFASKAITAPMDYASLCFFWTHIEKFWWWFKHFNRGGWIRGEEELRASMTVVTLRHYPKMSRQQIEDEIKTVFATFLFDRMRMSEIEMERQARFLRYVDSLLVALK